MVFFFTFNHLFIFLFLCIFLFALKDLLHYCYYLLIFMLVLRSIIHKLKDSRQPSLLYHSPLTYLHIYLYYLHYFHSSLPMSLHRQHLTIATLYRARCNVHVNYF